MPLFPLTLLSVFCPIIVIRVCYIVIVQVVQRFFDGPPCASLNHEIAPELTGHGLPLSKCEAYNRVYDQFYRSSVQRRRRWTAPEKVRMVEETFEPGMRVRAWWLVGMALPPTSCSLGGW